jgi:hypothetical protein
LLAALVSHAPAAAQPAAASGAASASAPTRTYALVSLIGDEFVVVSRRPEVGTHLNPNERTPLPVADPVFDRIAVAEIESLLLRAHPDKPVLRALIRDPRLFALQEKLLTESADSHDMRIALRDLLTKSGATDLFLVTKHRAAPTITTTTGKYDGPGTIGGIGFYIDNETDLYNSVSKVGGVGFHAPYAYLAVSLVDVGSMRVVKTANGLETVAALPAEKGGAEHAWDALTAKEKVDALEHVIRRAIDTA